MQANKLSSQFYKKPMCFASRFFPDFEAKYFINELELLALAWVVEDFEDYVYSLQFSNNYRP